MESLWHELGTLTLVPKCTLPRRRSEPRSDVGDFMHGLYYEWHRRGPAAPRKARRPRRGARRSVEREAVDAGLVERLASLAEFERRAQAEPGTHAEVTVATLAERAEAAAALAAAPPSGATVPAFMHELVLSEQCCELAVALRLHAIKWRAVALLKSSPTTSHRELRAVAADLPRAAELTPCGDETQVEAAKIATTCLGCAEAHAIYALHGAGWSGADRRLWGAMTSDDAFRCPRCAPQSATF